MSSPLLRKIISVTELAERRARFRSARQTVVQCHGCFDIVHPGHIRYLQFARQLGDVLVVSLTGDANIAKGPDRPYIPEELRAESLAALEFVDYVVVDPHPTAIEIIAAIRPDIYVKGREYAASGDPRFLRERELVEGYGGRVVFHSGDVVYSSTRLIPTLAGEERLDECRLRTLCLRHGISLADVGRAIADFEGLPVLVAGDVIRERYVLCDPREAADDSPAPALQRLGERTFWGGAAATALQLAALGARPTLVTALGSDPAGIELERELRARGVEPVVVPQRGGMPTQQWFIADDAKLFHVTEGAPAPLESGSQNALSEALLSLTPRARLLLWCDHGHGALTPGLVERVGSAARAAGVVSAATIGARGDATAMRGADLLTLSERRLRTALHNSGDSLPALVWNLLDRTGGGRAIVGLHKRGLLAFDGTAAAQSVPGGEAHPGRLKSEFVPVLASHFADPLGADEAVLAAAALTLAVQRPLPLALYLAAAAQALAVVRHGRSVVERDALHGWLSQRAELQIESRFVAQPERAADGRTGGAAEWVPALEVG